MNIGNSEKPHNGCHVQAPRSPNERAHRVITPEAWAVAAQYILEGNPEMSLPSLTEALMTDDHITICDRSILLVSTRELRDYVWFCNYQDVSFLVSRNTTKPHHTGCCATLDLD